MPSIESKWMRLRRSSAIVRVALVGALVLVGGCASPTVDAGHTEVTPNGDFFQLLRAIDVEYEFYGSLNELLKAADVVFVGEIESVEAGRAVGGERDQPEALETFLIVVSVQEVVRGKLASDSQQSVDLELYKPSLVSVEDVQQVRPREPLLFALTDTANLPQPSPVDDSNVDRDPTKTLYTIPSDTAIFMEQENDVITPLAARGDPLENSVTATNLRELVEEIKNL